MRIVFLTYPGLTALDAIGPYEVFNALREFEICFAWKEVGPIVTDSGALVLGATHALADISDCDVVIVPGSAAETLTMMADDEVLRWLREIDATTKHTASVCSGALILGAAGLLQGLPATTHWAGLSYLGRFGSTAMPDERIVDNGHILTAAGVSAGIDLALYLVGKLLGDEQAEMAQLLIEYEPRPPYDAGHMSKVSKALALKAQLKMNRTAAANPRNLLSVPKILLDRWTRSRRRSRR